MSTARSVDFLRKFFVTHFLIFAGLVLSAIAVPPELPNYFLRSWKTENGLPDNAVTAVAQTRDGYLWIGTYGGLARFDGVNFTVFNSATTPGLQSDRVTSLYEDAQGILWIGHERGDLTRYHDGKFESQELQETGNRRKISAIGTDRHGDIWVLNEEGTLVRARDGATCSLPNQNGVAELAQDGRGNLWMMSNGQLAELAQGQLKFFSNTNNSAGVSGYVEGVCPSRDGGLWIVTDSEVCKWDGRAISENRGTNPCNATVIAMLETKSGALAMGTSSDGLYLLFPDRKVLHFNQTNGFPNNWIRCLQEDREGTLWVGAGNVGLIAMRPGKIATLDAPDNWQGRVVLSTTTARDGAIWIGSEGAGLYRFFNGQWNHFAESAGLSNLYVWCVSEDTRGRMWAGTWGGGMFMQQSNQFIIPPGLENVNVPMPAILQTPDGVTWIGTVSGLLRYENGETKWFGEKDGLKSPDVRTILQDRNGTVWFGMLGGGLGWLKNGRVQQFLKSNSELSSDYIQCLHFGADGALWIGTYGSGLNRFKDGHFAKITSTEGLPNNFICGIEVDEHGNFWISSHGGIFRASQNSLNDCADGKIPFVKCLSYGIGDGLPSLECSGGLQPAACKLADGRICFPTSKGLVLVNPNDAKINPLPPPVVVENVMGGGRLLAENLSANSLLKIPAGLQRFEIHYAGLSFVAPEKMQFQYRLAGWEKDWVDAGNKRVAEYSYIAPGSYVFQVRACNSDGVWNQEGTSLALTLLPHFWQTLWFRFATILVAVALVVGIVLFITRTRMRRKLEIIQRQQAVERERTRIAKDIHDHLGANLTRISLLSQSAHGELENTAQAAAQLERIYETSRELTRSMDEIVWAVNPQHDTLDSLASYLGNFAQDYLVPLNVRCRLDVPLQLPHWPINAEMRHNIFLAFKETLHNVVKHSGATETSIIFSTAYNSFTVIIRDNGKGFDPANLPTRTGRGNGLKNMRQRLEKIGGQCEISSTPNAGTEIKFFISVPLTKIFETSAHVIN